MRRAWFVVPPIVLLITYVACVGDDPGVDPLPDAGSSADTSTANDTSTQDVSVTDAGADTADAADPCAVPPVGAGVACTPMLTCPKGQRCCNSLNGGQRDCVSTITGCAGIEVQCMGKNHCANGAEICCITTEPADASPSGTCPASVNAFKTECVVPEAGSQCPNGSLRLCGGSDDCPAGTACKQVDVNIGTPTPYRTGYCL